MCPSRLQLVPQYHPAIFVPTIAGVTLLGLPLLAPGLAAACGLVLCCLFLGHAHDLSILPEGWEAHMCLPEVSHDSCSSYPVLFPSLLTVAMSCPLRLPGSPPMREISIAITCGLVTTMVATLLLAWRIGRPVIASIRMQRIFTPPPRPPAGMVTRAR